MRVVTQLVMWIVVLVVVACSGRPAMVEVPPDITLIDGELSDLRHLRWSHDDIALAFAAFVPNQAGRGVFVVHPLIAAPPFRSSAAVELVQLSVFDEVADLRFTWSPRGVVAAVDDGARFGEAECQRFGAVWLPLGEPLSPLMPVDEPVLLHCSLRLDVDVYGRPGDITDHPGLHFAAEGGLVALGTTEGVVLVDLETMESRVLGPGLPVAFAPGGERLVTVEVEGVGAAATRTWRVVDVVDGAAIALGLAPTAAVDAVRWAPDGIVARVDGLVRNLTTGATRTVTLATATEVHLSPSGRSVAYATFGCVAAGPSGSCAASEATVSVVAVASGASHLAYRSYEGVANLSMAHDDARIAYTAGPRVLLSILPEP